MDFSCFGPRLLVELMLLNVNSAFRHPLPLLFPSPCFAFALRW